ncbi:MAG TPA: hypothetical protein DCE42_21295 [Myxococcales bacterium]|nr:hypothetical protein [Myxococcales bacterium]
MELFLFLVAAVLLILFLFSSTLPTPLEEEEEVWDSTEVRLESLLQGVMDPRAEIRERYRNRILAMGPHIIPRLMNIYSQELFLSQNQIRILRLQELLLDFGLRVVPPLLDLLWEEGDDPYVVEGVVVLLRQVGTPSLGLIMDKFRPAFAPHLAPLFREWGSPALREMINAFRAKPHEKIWHQLIVHFGEQATAPLCEAVDTWDGEAQQQAYLLLAQIADEDALPYYQQGLKSEHPLVRAECAFALGKVGSPALLQELLPLLQDDDLRVRCKTLPAIALLQQPEAIEPLLNHLAGLTEPADLQEHILCAVALSDLGVPSDESLIEKALDAHQPSIRLLAFELLRAVHVDTRLKQLEELLWDPDWKMVQQAIEMLLSIRSPKTAEIFLTCLEALHPDEPRFEVIEKALISLQEHATLPLMKRCKEPTSPLAIIALHIIIQGNDLRGLEHVLSLLHHSEEPELEWEVDPSEFLAYLERMAGQRDELLAVLKTFQETYPQSSLRPVLTQFAEPLPPAFAGSGSLSLETQTPGG